MTTFDIIRERLHAQAGIHEGQKCKLSYDQIRQQECNDGFAEKMDNRLVMGFLRYGPISKTKKIFYDLKKARERLDLYEKDGNLEHLVDAGNFCRLEFRRSRHPKKHFHAQDRK